MSQSREVYINYIVDQLRSGVLERKDVLVKFGNKWDKSETSFNRYWKTANERYGKELTTIKQNTEKRTLTAKEEEIERGILQRLDKLEILTQIARGIPYMVTGLNNSKTQITPTINNRIVAIQELNRMQGDTEENVNLNMTEYIVDFGKNI